MSHRIGIAVAAIALALTAASPLASAQPAQVNELAEKVAELETRIAKLEAQDQTNTQAIAEISTRLAEIEQELGRLGNLSKASPELIRRVDAIGLELGALAAEIETLRTQVADLEQPFAAASAATGGGGFYDEGFVLVDGDFSLTAYGYLQAQWLLRTPHDFATVTENTFRIRRARLGTRGKLGSIWDTRLRYDLMFDLSRSPALRDASIEAEIRPELTVRVGQRKMQHTRGFATSSRRLLFPERAEVIDDFRYDRDIGVWALGGFLDGRLGYIAGISNGGGLNQENDNIDLVAMGRVTGAVLGEPIPLSFGDLAGTEEPSLTVGASGVHDLVRVPERVGGIPPGNRDVDNDQVIDNVRVISAAADAIFRYRGLELYGEGALRHERWGTILSHSDNSDLAEQIDAGADGDTTYFGLVGHASYMVWPQRVIVGARAAYSRPTILGVNGRQKSRVPPADRLVELDAVGTLYHAGWPLLSAQYTFKNFNDTGGADPPFDAEHRFLIQSQLAF